MPMSLYATAFSAGYRQGKRYSNIELTKEGVCINARDEAACYLVECDHEGDEELTVAFVRGFTHGYTGTLEPGA